MTTQEFEIPIFINGHFVKTVKDYGGDRHCLPFFGHKDVMLERFWFILDGHECSLLFGEMGEESFKKHFDNDYARV